MRSGDGAFALFISETDKNCNEKLVADLAHPLVDSFPIDRCWIMKISPMQCEMLAYTPLEEWL
jgi:hypothetical protein